MRPPQILSPSEARQGLDLLLSSAPHLDLLDADWQEDGPWLMVTLGQPSQGEEERWARHRYAIFKRTGAVHGLQLDASVTDEPILVPTGPASTDWPQTASDLLSGDKERIASHLPEELRP
jgi:hypothetical protein